MKITRIFTILLAASIASNLSAAPQPKPPPPPQDVNVINDAMNPVPVTVQNPQTSVTVDNTTPIPVDVQGGVTISADPQFVGFSSATVTGDSGYPAINQACRDSFGAGARICSAREVIASIQPPVSASSPEGWVMVDVSNAYPPVAGWTDDVYNCMAFKQGGVPDNRNFVVSAATGEILSLTDNESVAIGSPRNYVLGSCSDSRAVACCK